MVERLWWFRGCADRRCPPNIRGLSYVSGRPPIYYFTNACEFIDFHKLFVYQPNAQIPNVKIKYSDSGNTSLISSNRIGGKDSPFGSCLGLMFCLPVPAASGLRLPGRRVQGAGAVANCVNLQDFYRPVIAA
jgi:hypothetical protein